MHELFDKDFYQRKYDGLIEGEPFEHYKESGWRQGYKPNPFLDPALYCSENKIEPLEPLDHLTENWESVEFISPAFDADNYQKYYVDVKSAGVSPFKHYLTTGHIELRIPGILVPDWISRVESYSSFDWLDVESHLGFSPREITHLVANIYKQQIDSEYYASKYAISEGRSEALEHYGSKGYTRGLKPNPYLDIVKFQNSDRPTRDPILESILTADNPCPYFSAKSYFRENPDAVSPELAFSHYVQIGGRENRSLGVSPEAFSAIKALHREYDWPEAERHHSNLLTPARDLGIIVDPEALEDIEALSLPPNSNVMQISSIELKASEKQLVSFDIWDTVLRRNCDPDEIKYYSAVVLQRELERLYKAPAPSAAELLSLRKLAEYHVSNEDYEYKHSDMLLEWLRLCGVTEEYSERLCKTLSRSEIEKEKKETRVDRTIIDVIEILSHKKIIAVSDFYFPKEVILELLEHHGIGNKFEEIYVSCDYMKTKRQGALFDLVLEKEGVCASDIFHIGDNVEADIRIPQQKKIGSYHYIDSSESTKKDLMRKIFEGVLAGDDSSMLSLLKRSYYTGTGLSASGDKARNRDLAALFAVFGMYILQIASSKNVEKIFFATREGIFFRKIYDMLADRDVLGLGQYPKSEILKVSRRATFAASLRSVSLEELMRIWSLYSKQSMAALSKSLNLPEKTMAKFCSRYEISVSEKIEFPWLDDRVKSMFTCAEFVNWISEGCVQQRKDLWAYLESIGFEPSLSKERLMVDIGWRGSIQDNLAFVVNGTLDGVYLAVYKYVAEQPPNGVKHGFAMDQNHKNSDELSEVASLEFISNGLGGSVVGYSDGLPEHEVVEEEEYVVKHNVLPLQEDILSMIEDIAPLLKYISLDKEGLGKAAKKLAVAYTKDPGESIADMFQTLAHNETFGHGTVDSIGMVGAEKISSLKGSAVHYTVGYKLREVRWSAAWLKSNSWKNIKSKLTIDQKLALPRINSLCTSPEDIRAQGKVVSIYAPAPIRGSGGHRTIYNLAKALDQSGFEVHLFSEYSGDEYEYKEEELSGSNVKLYDHWFAGLIPDAAIATVQHSSPYLTQFFSNDVKKFYFIQDFEAQFNPVSDGYVRGENSYAEGHNPLCIGRWLSHLLRLQYGTAGASAGLGVNTSVYRPLGDSKRIDRIAVLYQPEKWRRMPEHCLSALTKIKSRRPDIEIVFYGSKSEPNVQFAYTHLGLVDDLEQLNSLYNSSRIGLCASLTNPSRIPFEMMAAGCVPVDVYRYNNLFDYEDGTAVLAYQSSNSISGAILGLLEDTDKIKRRSENCIKIGLQRSLQWEVDATTNAIEHVLDGGDFDSLEWPLPSYNEPPFIAQSDDKAAVRSWCSWQLSLANQKSEKRKTTGHTPVIENRLRLIG